MDSVTPAATMALSKPLSGAAKLRQLLADTSNIVVAPGVYDGISARLAMEVGFDALYMTGAGTSMSRLGQPDLGIATHNDMVAQASMLASLRASVPLIADADTGYGGPLMVSRTVRAYAAAGVAALHIEDQVQEKRCGHLLGKELVGRDIFYSRLRAAINARAEFGLDILIIARTDARQSLGFNEAYQRLKGAVDIGVDAVFPEAMTSRDEAAEMVRRFTKMRDGGGVPCLLNMVSGGVTPDLSVEEARDLGYRLMIFPCLTLEPATVGMRAELRRFKKERKQPEGNLGVTGGGDSTMLEDRKMSVKEMFELCGLEDCMRVDREAGGVAYGTGV